MKCRIRTTAAVRRAAALGLGVFVTVAVGQAIGAELSCSSDDGRFRRCPLTGASDRDVRLARTLGSAECRRDFTWGADSSGVWVDQGCRAVFAYGDAGRGSIAGADARKAASAGEARKVALGGRVYSPARGVVCDPLAGFCADAQGISMDFTEIFLGIESRQKFAKIIANVKTFDRTSFTLSSGTECRAAQKACYTRKGGDRIDRRTTQALFP